MEKAADHLCQLHERPVPKDVPVEFVLENLRCLRRTQWQTRQSPYHVTRERLDDLSPEMMA